MKIWLDMDGTIADLYSVDGWLEDLINSNVRPYAEARGIGNLSLIARYLNKAQQNGHTIGIISWTSKNGTNDYNKAVEQAKKAWLARHLASVTWDSILVVEYGTNKRATCGEGLLFDDEERNREAWGNGAFEPCELVEVLKTLCE